MKHLSQVRLESIAASLVAPLLLSLSVPQPLAAQGALGAQREVEGAVERALIGQPFRTQSLDQLYRDWRWRHDREGGDSHVEIALGPLHGSTAQGLRGRAVLDLLAGEVRVRLDDPGATGDVWLVDNRPGVGSFLPDPGDRMHRLGPLVPGEGLHVELSEAFFLDFELDLVVVTPVGGVPTDTMEALGTRGVFARRYTRERTGTSGGPSESLDVDPRAFLGLVSREVLAGAELFFRGEFDGNGRSCGTCHPPFENQTIDANFVRNLDFEDPFNRLLVAEVGQPNPVPELERPELMRSFGLILENVDGFESPGTKFLMRSVPHSLSLSTSLEPPGPGPDGILPDGSSTDFVERTGWSGDGVSPPGTLRLFPAGAVAQHYTRDFQVRDPGPTSFRLPTDEELDQLEAFMRSVGRTQELDLAKVSLADASAEAGRVLFTTGPGGAKCFGCHNQGGSSFVMGGNRNFDTGVERLRHARLDELLIPRDGGFGGQGRDAFDFDADGDGRNDSFGNGGFNTPPVIEAADTAPFFHTNATETLEEAVAFYVEEEFARSPAGAMVVAVFGEGIDLTAAEVDQVADFLRVLNAGFNLSLAAQRISAALRVSLFFGGSAEDVIDPLLELANAELEDAYAVLLEKDLNPAVRADVLDAVVHVALAVEAGSYLQRLLYGVLASLEVRRAAHGLGTGLTFTLGEGNLTF